MPLLIAALGEMLVFVFRQIVVKFVLFTVMYLLLTQLAPLLTSYLPNGANVSALFNSLPSAVLWFLNISAFDVTFPMIIVAYFTRFFIRRIPFIG
ncbi:DUF2523 domain-containing protein [Salmonella enterica subsp. enterica serovar Newport]|uniref:DUF2523 domain-containing protein n=2 Tax=Salmonella enterica TaxID=28901 RepID=A0A5Z4ELN3_SALER|nr:DUF2523 family protein [Salmonella enterica]EBR7995500.1 DUF2523 domain-containing protein [Salmonella enterica subsp. enterica serovar Panama]ECA0400403.1 DUF2523 domain-containing protein [Salmonella enterica subsp. enterica serovar Newport]ECU5463645.1 DUF2523 domain-containing protein [Salmonella enterica subsp. enterica serovar Muenchen]EDR5914987.1 DUF2523 domain-containing protein [Salmonella enterica subsp. diarizonae]EEN2096139.1 DUF2523 domain-containing protein [Salmonella enteri